jgi:hypothetical protein
VIVLDTNVLSALMHMEPDAKVMHWLDTVEPETAWITTISVFELRYGIEQLPSGRRRRQLEGEFDRVMETGFLQRIVPLDHEAAAAAARIAAVRKRLGKPTDLRDTLIAGIVLSRRATLATRNVRHFADLDVRVVNPWTA